MASQVTTKTLSGFGIPFIYNKTETKLNDISPDLF